MFKTAYRFTALVLATSWLVAGCANDKELYNYVQPGFVKKDHLLYKMDKATGECVKDDLGNCERKTWYYRRTVVDAPETGGAWSSIGSGDLFVIQRVQFRVEEGAMLGYTDYQLVDNSEEGEYEGSDIRDFGSPLITIPILAHFDITRTYDPNTLTPGNVVAPNMERPWFEREYVRLLWNRIGFSDNPWLMRVEMMDNVPGAGGQAYVDEDAASNPWRARITPADGYMDVVVDHNMWPDLYDCYSKGLSPWACGSGISKVRHAFMERDETREDKYDPLFYPDSVPLHDADGNEIIDEENNEALRAPVFEKFGFFRLDRLTYDRQYGHTESGIDYKIIRFDIWENSYDADGNVLPYAERTPAPIHYYLNHNFPTEMMGAAQEVAAEWNGVFKRTVASLQGKSADDASIPDMFQLHVNSCSRDAIMTYLLDRPELLETVRETVYPRESDRVMPNGDPVTTGTLMTEATVVNFCAATEYHTQGLEDAFTWQQVGDPRVNMLAWIPNVIRASWSGYGPMLADPVTGRNVVSTAYLMGWTVNSSAQRAVEYIEYINGDITLQDLLNGATVPNGYNSPDYTPLAAEDSIGNIDEAQERAQREATVEHLMGLENRFRSMGDSKEEMMPEMENSQHYDDRLGRVLGTSFEEEYLISDYDRMIASEGQWLPGDGVENFTYADPRLNPSHGSRMTDNHENALDNFSFWSKHTFDVMAELDDSLVGLASEMTEMTHEEKYQFMREQIFKAVALHEVGHNVGLRHNFEGSFDALNFNEKFWDLEESGLTEETKVAQKQPEYKYSSIMDYHGRVNGDFHGLGKYDEAAIKFGYGQIIEQFNSASKTGEELRQFRFQNDYRKLSCAEGAGSVAAMFDRSDLVFDWNKPGLTQTEYETATANEVPYLFCSDEYAGRLPTCNVWDFGANFREIQEARYVRYKNYFIFTNYLRHRLRLNMGGLMYRGQNAFYRVLNTYQYMYMYRANEDKLFDRPFFETDLGQDMATAVGSGLNMISEVVAMPEPGRYYRCVNPDDENDISYYPSWYVSYSSIQQADPTNPIGYGTDREECIVLESNSQVLEVGNTQPLFLNFGDDFVSWEFTYIGTYFDKQDAIWALTYPRAFFPRMDQAVDRRSYSISLARLYEPEVLNLISSMVTRDKKRFASRFVEGSGFIPATMVDLDQSVDSVGLVANSGASAVNSPVIPPLFTNLQRQGVLYGMAFLSSPLDTSLDFSKHTRVVLEGAMDDVGAMEDGDPDVVSCRLLESGQVYRARSTGSAFDIGYQQVEECAEHVQTLEDITWEDIEAQFVITEAAKEAYMADQEDIALRDAYWAEDVIYDQLRRDRSRAYSRYTSIQQMLQYMRRMHLVFEHGIDL